MLQTATARTEGRRLAASATKDYQQQLLSQSAPTSTSPDAGKLMAYNGYYIWSESPGGFLAIDANLVYKGDAKTSFYQVDLLVCLDGVHCERIPFTGSFDGSKLEQQLPVGRKLQAIFSRVNDASTTDKTVVITASCNVTISDTGTVAPITFTAITYNNPIPYTTFIGTYYNTADSPAKPALRIEPDFQLFYDGGKDGGELTAVGSWVYNMNMYFFYCDIGTASTRFIMGSSAKGGLVCNNMIYDGQLTQRTIQTIVASPALPGTTDNPAAALLMPYCGYYQLKGAELAPGAFLSLQGQYECTKGGKPVYSVAIGLSLDGSTVTLFNFDTTMTFSDGTLIIPASAEGAGPTHSDIRITFKRGYDSATYSLVALEGSVGSETGITGNTLFNPVPLTAFGGVPLTNTMGERLDINNEYSITLNGKTIDSFVYVPVMYIWYSAAEMCELSLGTNGANGNACIVLQALATPHISSVFSIPGNS